MSSAAGEEPPVKMINAGDVVQVGIGPHVLKVRSGPATVKVDGPVAKTTIKVLSGEVEVDVGPGEEPVIKIKTTGQGASLNVVSVSANGGRSGASCVNMAPGKNVKVVVKKGGSMVIAGHGDNMNMDDFNRSMDDFNRSMDEFYRNMDDFNVPGFAANFLDFSKFFGK